jgi:hypothetical protein
VWPDRLQPGSRSGRTRYRRRDHGDPSPALAACGRTVPPIKLIALAITIGSRGPSGREGPAAQNSASFGSLLGQ